MAAATEKPSRNSVSFLAAAGLLAWGSGVFAADARAIDSCAAFAPVRARMDQATTKGDVPSLSLAVIRAGRIVCMVSSGFADIERRAPATPDTVYRIGSVSKSITGAAVFIAALRKQVDLERPVTDYLPWTASLSGGRFRSATIAALLAMNAGMTQAVHYRGTPGGPGNLDASRFTRTYALAPMSPGPRYLYSNMGPELAARATAAATHRDLEAFVRGAVLEPLGMNATFLASARVPRSSLANSYRGGGKLIAESYEIDPVAGAGYLASTRDLARFALFQLTGRSAQGKQLLAPREIEVLHTPREGAFYAFGWGRVGTGSETLLLSDGQVSGGQAVIVLAPGRGVGVIAAANAASARVNEIAFMALDLMAPGMAGAFESNASLLEEGLQRETLRLVPAGGAWSATGTLTIEGHDSSLAVTASESTIELHLDEKLLARGSPLPPEEGFARWKIDCPRALPACGGGADENAVFMLTRGADSLDGVIAVESLAGLFPYEVHLSR